MKINKREKRLLILLLVVIISYGYNKLVVVGQGQLINTLKAERDRYDLDLSTLNQHLSAEAQYNSNFLEFNDSINQLKNGYFLGTPQEEYILLINEYVKASGLKLLDVKFTKEQEEKLGKQDFYYMTANIEYEADYTSLMAFIRLLRSYNKTVVINEMKAATKSNELLGGNITLSFYSLSMDFEDNMGDLALFQQDASDSYSPFRHLNSKNDSKDPDNIEVTINIGPGRVLLKDLEASSSYSINTSNRNIRGGLYDSSIAKVGNSSLRVEYEFPRQEDTAVISIGLASNSIVITQPPKALALWVYSFNSGKNPIWLMYKTADNQLRSLRLTDEQDWVGWQKLEATLTHDNSLYPIKLESIAVVGSGLKEKGVLLLDALEAIYDEEAVADPILEDMSGYWFYEVQANESLRDISMKFYNDTKGIEEIMKVNGLKSQSNIISGKLLIIPKR